MIDRMIQPILDEDVWKLADLLAAQRLGEALILMQRLLDDQRGHELVPGWRIGFVAWALARGSWPGSCRAARSSGGRPTLEVRRSAHLLKNWTPNRMIRALDALHRADDRLKGGWGGSERATMEALCLEVCSA